MFKNGLMQRCPSSSASALNLFHHIYVQQPRRPHPALPFPAGVKIGQKISDGKVYQTQQRKHCARHHLRLTSLLQSYCMTANADRQIQILAALYARRWTACYLRANPLLKHYIRHPGHAERIVVVRISTQPKAFDRISDLPLTRNATNGGQASLSCQV